MIHGMQRRSALGLLAAFLCGFSVVGCSQGTYAEIRIQRADSPDAEVLAALLSLGFSERQSQLPSSESRVFWSQSQVAGVSLPKAAQSHLVVRFGVNGTTFSNEAVALYTRLVQELQARVGAPHVVADQRSSRDQQLL
jgi:hypothetical protein